MKLIEEIINILSSENGKLSDALIKTKVLLHKIGHKELVEWVNHELNGYPERDSVPPYRILPAQVLVNASNMAYQVTAHPIPLGHLDEDYRSTLETAKMNQSLAVLEKYAELSEGHLQSPIPMEANGILGEGLSNGYQIIRAWCEVQKADVIQILTQVRSRLLDFLLELNANLSGELNEDEVKEKANDLDTANLFNNTIFGDNTTILVGSGSTQHVQNTNLKGNFDALQKTLEGHGVSENDIKALRKAIQDDAKVIEPDKKEYGPAVKDWLQTMLSKAVEASWQIELGIASSLLATALQNYYGWF
ncbi:response regulator receiver protein [Kangiella profundi]|uniref:Response regulator receiver protein n=1 Tax=Kangiella profundi TaxID=1561924 RepID=A0A2K9A8A2_9GAMM|nr:response regulator receiver protein [Kangiella profundi]AUD78950.1 response regulator receiver protein [Kangiella profundi]GGF02747.1 hypothetical protein GCM10011356_15560 [Kangiella profundi]